MISHRLYLDNNADTPECQESLNLRMTLLASEPFPGNPSAESMHVEGKRGRDVLTKARSRIEVECNAPKMIFTSGATESVHLAIRGGMNACGSSCSRIVVTPFEHPCVKRETKDDDRLKVRLLETGEVDAAHLAELCSEPDVGMLSLILAHNEIGIVQPLAAVRTAVETARRNRETRDNRPIFHLDATQILGKARFNFSASGADMASWSAHKFHGPGGVGGLFVTDAVATETFLRPSSSCCACGGEQELGLRAGTENSVGAACAAAALKRCDELGGDGGRWAATAHACDDLAERLATLGPACTVIAHPGKAVARRDDSGRLCNTVSVSFPGRKGHDIARGLSERHGISVSTGSACSCSSRSKALKALGLSDSVVAGALRISASPIAPLPTDFAARCFESISALLFSHE